MLQFPARRRLVTIDETFRPDEHDPYSHDTITGEGFEFVGVFEKRMTSCWNDVRHYYYRPEDTLLLRCNAFKYHDSKFRLTKECSVPETRYTPHNEDQFELRNVVKFDPDKISETSIEKHVYGWDKSWEWIKIPNGEIRYWDDQQNKYTGALIEKLNTLGPSLHEMPPLPPKEPDSEDDVVEEPSESIEPTGEEGPAEQEEPSAELEDSPEPEASAPEANQESPEPADPPSLETDGDSDTSQAPVPGCKKFTKSKESLGEIQSFVGRNEPVTVEFKNPRSSAKDALMFRATATCHGRQNIVTAPGIDMVKVGKEWVEVGTDIDKTIQKIEEVSKLQGARLRNPYLREDLEHYRDRRVIYLYPESYDITVYKN